MMYDELIYGTGLNHRGTPRSDPAISKLNCVLEKILRADFQTQDDSVLDKLFDLIAKKWPAEDVLLPKASSEISSLNEALDIFPSWLTSVADSWNSVTHDVRVLTLRLAGHLASTEAGLNRLTNVGVTDRLLGLARSTRMSNECGGSRNMFSLTVSFVEMIKSFTSHNSGILYILKHELWQDVLDVALTSRSIYALKSAWKCFSLIVLFLLKSNNELAHSITVNALSLKTSNGISLTYGQLNDPKPFDEALAFKHVPEKGCEKTLNTVKLAQVLITTLLDHGHDQSELLSFFRKSQLDNWMWTELHYGQNEELLKAVSKLNCLFNILHIEHFRPGFTSDLKARLMTKLISQHCYLLVHRQLFIMILDMCVEYQELWSKFGGETVQSENEDKKNFKCSSNECSEDYNYSVLDGENRVQNCLLIIQAVPLFMAINFFSTRSVELDIYVDKIFYSTSPKIVRLGYFFRERLFVGELSIPQITQRSILQFIRLTEIGLKKPQALSVFQAMNHLMKCFTKSPPPCETEFSYYVRKEGAGDDLLMKHPNILSSTLKCLSCLINKFHFSPNDCLEATCLLSILQELLVNPLVSPSLCVDTLKLIKLVLLKFMPPNLALLVNTLQGSSISELGEQLYKTLLKVNWEVQDSALEVIQVISRLAVTEFPAFEHLLLQNDLAGLVLVKAENEPEPYVRASSMVCLKEMVKIDAVWNNSLKEKNLLEKILWCLHYETEGIVRTQAGLLVESMFRNKRIPESSLDRVFDSLQIVSQSDLHWEVKQSALIFWKAVIDNQFSQEGMIDGHFPEVVFSKEKKKIVQMTPTETNARVFNAFNKLSSNGCLQVLWDSFHKECDLQVQKMSLEMIKRLMEIARIFQLVENVKSISRPMEMEFLSEPQSILHTPTFEDLLLDEDKMVSDVHRPDSYDDVIDDIVSQRDLELLKYIALDGVPRSPPQTLPKKIRIRFPPLEFIAKLSSVDLDAVLKAKSDWSLKTSEGLESLLDDILLHCREILPVNSVDCY